MYAASDAAPAKSWKVIAPSDTVNMAAGCRGIYVGGAGNISIMGEDGASAVLTAVPIGTFIPCGARRVNFTNTTATLMVALY